MKFSTIKNNFEDICHSNKLFQDQINKNDYETKKNENLIITLREKVQQTEIKFEIINKENIRLKNKIQNYKEKLKEKSQQNLKIKENYEKEIHNYSKFKNDSTIKGKKNFRINRSYFFFFILLSFT